MELGNENTAQLVTVGHTGTIYDVAANEKAGIFVSGGADGVLRVWSIASCDLLHAIPLGKEIRAVAISPNGRNFVAGLSDGRFKIFESQTAKQTRNRDCGLTTMGRWSGDIAWPNQSTLVFSNGGEKVTLWNLEEDDYQDLFGPGVVRMEVLSAEQLLVHQPNDGFAILNLANHEAGGFYSTPDFNQYTYWSVSPDKKQLAFGNDGDLAVMEVGERQGS